jgi:uncharacterized membrane protein
MNNITLFLLATNVLSLAGVGYLSHRLNRIESSVKVNVRVTTGLVKDMLIKSGRSSSEIFSEIVELANADYTTNN